jgi:plasmid stabilization system protein ParE
MKILFSINAKLDFDNLLDYLTSQWGYTIAEKFKSKTKYILQLISLFPYLGVEEVVEKQIRSYALTKQIRVFYTIKKEKIIILAFIDVRQNPKNKKY